MDLSLLAYREVVAEKFLLSLNSQVEPVKWYSSMEFLRYFTKYGEFTSETCNTGEVVTKDDLSRFLNILLFFGVTDEWACWVCENF